MTHALCPRCSHPPKRKVVYGIQVLQCSLLECGAVLTGSTVEEADLKWNARTTAASDEQCPHCGGNMEPFEFNFAGLASYGFKCTGCGCSTGGRTTEAAEIIRRRRP